MGSAGKKTATGSETRDYYASFAGVICYGPVDALVSLLIDGKAAWQPGTPVLRTASANPYVFDVDGYGRVHFYWGTEDQTLTDPVLTKPGRDHPPYRRRAVAVFEKFLCGRERTSVPDISFVLRRSPKSVVVTGAAAELDADGQANPIAAVAELLCDGVMGLGLPASALDSTSFQATADALLAAAPNEYLTVETTQVSRLRAVMGLVNGYADTWWRVSSNGQIGTGVFTKDENPAGLRVISRHDLAHDEEPRYVVRSTADADGRLTLKFINRLRAFEDDYAVFNHGLRRDQLEREDPAEIDRRWIRRAGQAAHVAAKIGAREGMSFYQFDLQLREEKADGILPGELVVFQDDVWDVTFLARVITRAGDGDVGGTVKIELETERTIGEMAGTGASDITTPEPQEALTDIYNWTVLRATPALLEANNENYGTAVKLFFLAGRHQESATDYGVYFRKLNTSAFQFMGVAKTWAVPLFNDSVSGPLSSGPMIDDSGNIRLGVSRYPSGYVYSGFDDFNTAPSEDEIEDDACLLIWINADERIYEIMTVTAVLPYSPGVYKFHVRRGRLGTVRRDHNFQSTIFMVSRYELQFFSHLSLPTIAAALTSEARTITCDVAPRSTRDSLPPGTQSRYLRLG